MKFTNIKNAIVFAAIAVLFPLGLASSAWADGNVSVRFTAANQLTIIGDTRDNAIEIRQDGKYLKVIAHNGTALNNRPLIRELSFLFSRAQSARELVIDLGAGNDELEIHDTQSVTKIEASTGAGKDYGDFRNLNVRGDVALACADDGVLNLVAVDARWLICHARECELRSTDSNYLWVFANDVGLFNTSADEVAVTSLPGAARTTMVIDSAEATNIDIRTLQSNSKDNIEITRCEVVRDVNIRSGDQYDYVFIDRTECRDLDIDLGSSTSYDICLVDGGDFRDVSIVNNVSQSYISINEIVAEFLDIDVEGSRNWTYLARSEFTEEANVKLGSGSDYLSVQSCVTPYAFFDGDADRDVLNQRGNLIDSSDIINFEIFTR